jgi:Lon protease-like protein
MSEELEKVSEIKHLPVFPLPLVLLPNELLPLHIFEDRYRRMLADVLQEKRLFGLSFLDAEQSAERPAIGTVGCAAEVREAEMLEDGRSNILTLGLVRYRLLGYVDAGEPYIVAEVEFFEDDPEDDAVLKATADEVFELFERVAKAAFKMSGSRGQFPEIARTTPEKLSFVITAAFNLDNDLKYRLLETASTTDRLTKLKEILGKTVVQMEESADIHSVSQTNGHSPKKLDI